jgi:phenylalanyl-tRNA synthetase alpha chain
VSLDIETRKQVAQELNTFKEQLIQALDAKNNELKEASINAQLQAESIDVTLPPREGKLGKVHPISQAFKEIVDIFLDMGFEVKDGPNIEDDFHNFTSLNIAEHHPARDMHDTFYLGPDRLLRTHTSTVQIRAMQGNKPPFRFIAVGQVYRCDSDATHTPMFHQLEAVCVDKGLSMGHLKGCLEEFINRFFEGRDIKVRFRPSFFPFTEPSAEVDISIDGSKWLEVLGSGMIHPNVLKNVGVDASVYQGFAFGAGIDRLAMLKYGINDLRAFFDNDVRWLNRFGFSFYE